MKHPPPYFHYTAGISNVPQRIFGDFGEIQSRSITTPIPHTTIADRLGRSTSEVF